MSKEICEHGTDRLQFKVSINIDLDSIGESKSGLCGSCRVNAEIELRDFIKQSKYFVELEPFG